MRKIVTLLLSILLLLTATALALPVLDSQSSIPKTHTCSNYISSNKTFIADHETIYTGLACKPTAILTLYQIKNQEKLLITNATKVNGKLPKFIHYHLENRFYYECYSCKDLTQNTKPILTAPDKITRKEGENIAFTYTCTDPDGDLTFSNITGKFTGVSRKAAKEDVGSYTTAIECRDEYGAKVEKTINITIITNNAAPIITAINTQ